MHALNPRRAPLRSSLTLALLAVIHAAAAQDTTPPAAPAPQSAPAEEPATTLDKVKIDLLANIEGPDDVDAVIESGADGVGLFRTEFIFLGSGDMPSEDEQFEAYRKAVKRRRQVGKTKFYPPHLHRLFGGIDPGPAKTET